MTCPFCEAVLQEAGPHELRALAEPHARMGRAAVHAFGIAAFATTLAACKDPSPPAVELPDVSAPQPTSEPSATAPASASAAAAVAPVASVEPDGSAPLDAATATAANGDAGMKKIVPPATTKTAPPIHRNHAKPYGAPPADGLLRIV